MINVFFDPVDVLRFGDGRPFAAGTDHRGGLVFPPSVFTGRGALRKGALFSHCKDISEYRNNCQDCRDIDDCVIIKTVQYIGELGAFSSVGPYPALFQSNVINYYFPAPIDFPYFSEKERRMPLPLVYVYKNQHSLSASLADEDDDDVAIAWSCSAGEVNMRSRFISTESLKNYLLLREDKANGSNADKEVDNHFKIESRVGIAMDEEKIKSVLPGFLHVSDYVHPEKFFGYSESLWGLAMRLNFPGLEEGLLTLGGKSRLAEVKKSASNLRFDESEINRLKELLDKTGHFRLFFASPAKFGENCRPTSKWPGWCAHDGLGPEDITLVGRCFGRSQPLARRRFGRKADDNGWAVPAGSVFYFRINNKKNIIDKVIDCLHNKCVSENEEDRKIGLGHAFVGGVEVV